MASFDLQWLLDFTSAGPAIYPEMLLIEGAQLFPIYSLNAMAFAVASLCTFQRSFAQVRNASHVASATYALFAKTPGCDLLFAEDRARRRVLGYKNQY